MKSSATIDILFLLSITLLGGIVGLLSGGYVGWITAQGYEPLVKPIVYGFVGMMIGALLSVYGGIFSWVIGRQLALTSPQKKNWGMLLCSIPLVIGMCILVYFHQLRSQAVKNANKPRPSWDQSGRPNPDIRLNKHIYYVIAIDTLFVVAATGVCVAAGIRTNHMADSPFRVK